MWKKGDISNYLTKEEWEEWWLAKVIHTCGDEMEELGITDCFFCNASDSTGYLKCCWFCFYCSPGRYGHFPCYDAYDSETDQLLGGWERIKTFNEKIYLQE
jgi:hypothetical protein